MADMLTPQDLWDEFDDNLPLNAACELQREDSEVRIEKVTFDGRDTGQGRVRVYAKFATSAKKGILPYTVILLPDACRTIEEDLFAEYIRNGYNVLMPDYRGAYEGLDPAWRNPKPIVIRRRIVRETPAPEPAEDIEPAAETPAEDTPVSEPAAETGTEAAAPETPADELQEAPAEESAEAETATPETAESPAETAETETLSESSKASEPAETAEAEQEDVAPAEENETPSDEAAAETAADATAEDTEVLEADSKPAPVDADTEDTEGTAEDIAADTPVEDTEDTVDAELREASEKPVPAEDDTDSDESLETADTEFSTQETADTDAAMEDTAEPIPAEDMEKLEEEVSDPALAETEDTDNADAPVEDTAEDADAEQASAVAEDAAEAPAQTSEKVEDMSADADESAETEDICAVTDTAEPAEDSPEDTEEDISAEAGEAAEDSPDAMDPDATEDSTDSAEDTDNASAEPADTADSPAEDTEAIAEPEKESPAEAEDESADVTEDTAETATEPAEDEAETVSEDTAGSDVPVEYTVAADGTEVPAPEEESEAPLEDLPEGAEEQETIALDESLAGEDVETPEEERQEEIGAEAPPEGKEPDEDEQLQIDLDKALADAAGTQAGDTEDNALEDQLQEAAPEEEEKPAEPEEPEYEEIIIQQEPAEPHLGEYYTVYPENVKYANWTECKDNLCFADNGADRTCWYEWTAVGLYARKYIQERTGSDRIGIVGIREGGEVMWKMAAARKFYCAIPICAAGWKTSAGKMKFEKPVKEAANFSVSLSGELSEEKGKSKKAGRGKKAAHEEVKKPDYSNKQFNFMAGLDSQSYAPYVKCPVLVVCSVNDPRFDYDRAYDTYLRINREYMAESSIVYAMNFNSFIDDKCRKDMFLFLNKELKGHHVFLPRPVAVDITVDRMQNLIARVLTDQEGVSSDLAVYYAEDTVNPVLRTWTEAERVKGSRNEFMLNIFEGTKSLFVLASASYTNGFKSWSKVIVKSISGRFRNMLHHSPVIYSSMLQNEDGFIPVGMEKHAVGGVFLDKDAAKLETVKVLDIEALSAPDGIETYSISKPRYAPNPGSIMHLDIYVEKDTNIYLIITDLKTGEDYVYTDYIMGDIWQSLDLSANAFKCGHKGMTSFVCEGKLTIRADGFFAVNNIMWL